MPSHRMVFTVGKVPGFAGGGGVITESPCVNTEEDRAVWGVPPASWSGAQPCEACVPAGTFASSASRFLCWGGHRVACELPAGGFTSEA